MVLPAGPHLHLLLHDGEDPLDAEADAHARPPPATLPTLTPSSALGTPACVGGGGDTTPAWVSTAS